ncbi:hypothetical protein OGAPHI_005991 [Ogataea philodendri]|uniref:Uncharacterized protein n=2 Tax=Saccharomycotina TaxID=147537 RepID=A0A9P8NXP2_9ASCO|nr:uncharacterized protein OGAPHI_005991 [Ogataea philodendri]KAH3661813.1 hypothetical protein OGAPHI_005991 [Ogataea philodendri]
MSSLDENLLVDVPHLVAVSQDGLFAVQVRLEERNAVQVSGTENNIVDSGNRFSINGYDRPVSNVVLVHFADLRNVVD